MHTRFKTLIFCLLFTLIWKTSLPFLSPTRREAFTLAASLVGKGVRGLGFSWIFLHGVKSQLFSAPSSLAGRGLGGGVHSGELTKTTCG